MLKELKKSSLKTKREIKTYRCHLTTSGKIYLSYTIIFSIMIFFFLHIMGGFSLIKGDDGYNQYFPTMVYIGKYIREILSNFLHGNFYIKQFDFTIGLGEGVVPALNYYGFGDPFMLLYALVPASYAAYGYTAIIVLKLYVAGISFIYYCSMKGKSSRIVLAAVMVYLLSTYSLFYGIQYPTYLNAMITVPILCAGIDNAIARSHIHKPIFKIILAVAFQAVTGFYQLYMLLIFAGIYALINIICHSSKFLEGMERIVELLVQVALGLLLGAVILFPSIYGFFTSSRTGEITRISLQNLLIMDSETYLSMFKQVVIPTEWSATSLALPVMALLGMVCSWKSSAPKEWKITLVVVMIMYVGMRCTSWVMGGLTSNIYYNRWGFYLYFVVAYMVFYGLEHMVKNQWKLDAICGGRTAVPICYILARRCTVKTDFDLCISCEYVCINFCVDL